VVVLTNLAGARPGKIAEGVAEIYLSAGKPDTRPAPGQ
jgi:hypothetical protein